MRLLFTICGRAGSKGIKNKNIRDFLGIPLPLYTLSAIDLYRKNHKEHETDIALNTDSPELTEIMQNSEICSVDLIKRKEELGGDLVAKKDVIKDTYMEMRKKNACDYDIVIDLDITSPLRTETDISKLVEEKIGTSCDVAFSVTESRRNPYFNMVMKAERGYKKVIASDYVARQQAEDIYDMNASMYAYDPQFLLSNKGILDGYCEIIQMYDTGILDLDHENDFELMQVIARYLFDNRPEFRVVQENALKL